MLSLALSQEGNLSKCLARKVARLSPKSGLKIRLLLGLAQVFNKVGRRTLRIRLTFRTVWRSIFGKNQTRILLKLSLKTMLYINKLSDESGLLLELKTDTYRIRSKSLLKNRAIYLSCVHKSTPNPTAQCTSCQLSGKSD